ncbi:MAG: FAD binding domain-containing protein [Bacilli bacterium]|nr:FAD binding domain-containing protein [Bacilli bacterium]
MNSYIPTSLEEALKILFEHDCYILAGGTDLMVQNHRSSGLLPTFKKDVLFTSQIEGLDYIKVINNELHIGANTKYISMIESKFVPTMLKNVFVEIASPSIRNMATLTGNINNASPAADGTVPLILLDARLVLQSKDNKREISVDDYLIGFKKTDRKPNEMVTEIIVPLTDHKYLWRKVGSRKAESISKVTFLGAYKTSNNKISDFRIALGCVSIKPVRSKQVESKYIGLTIDELKNKKDEIVNDYNQLIEPVTDQRSNKEYKRKVAINLLKSFIDSIK